MRLSVSSAKITGNPDAKGWAQVHDFTPAEEEKFQSRGRLIAIIATTRLTLTQEKAGGLDTVALGREILTRLHEEYYGKKGPTAFHALKEAVKKVVQEFSDENERVEIGAASLMDGVMHVAVAGGVRAVLLRNGMLVDLLQSKVSLEVVSASGHPEEGDSFLLGTKALFSNFPEGTIKAALANTEAVAAAEALAPGVHVKEDLGNLGAAIVNFAKQSPLSFTKIDQPSPKPSQPKVNRFLAALIDRLITIFAAFQVPLKLIFPERKIVIKDDTRTLEGGKRKKVAITSGFILLVLLGVSIFFGLQQKFLLTRRQKYESRLTQAQHEFEEAQSLSGLNPTRARELILNSQRIALELKDEGVEDPDLELLLKDIHQDLGRIAGIYQITPELYLDLSLVSSGFQGQDIFHSEGEMLVFDRRQGKLVSIDIATKKTEVVAGPDDISGARAASIYSERYFVLKEEGIYEVDEKLTRMIDSDWEGEVMFIVYAGNVYVLEKEPSIVWRYPGISGGKFASKNNWFGPGVKPDLSNTASWAIDGSIWFLSDTGRITKFTFGKQDPFSISISDLSPKYLYTDETAQFLYLLEPEKQRIIVVDKEGEFKAEYQAEAISQTKEIVVSEEEKKLILLTGDKLLEIDLGHL